MVAENRITQIVRDDEIIGSINKLAKSSNRTSNISFIIAVIALIISGISSYYAFKDDSADANWRETQYEYFENQLIELKSLNTNLKSQNENLIKIIESKKRSALKKKEEVR